MNQTITFAEARALHQAGRLADAERAYSALLDDAAENPQLLYLAGAVAFQLGKLELAQDRLQQALSITPDNPQVLALMGQFEEASSRWTDALQIYDRVLELIPDDAFALTRRAFVLEMSGNVDAASREFRRALEASFTGIHVDHYSRWRNIYHCCTQKTASQWLRRIFSDAEFYRATGLLMQPYVQLGLNSAEISQPWPAGTVVTHLYVNHDTFHEMPKPDAHRAFFILRDPRDCVVSWYHSARYSHNSANPILWLREQLSTRSESDGYMFMIDWLNEVGFFDAQRSWVAASGANSDFRIYRYEDLNRTPREFVEQLFDYLEVPMTAMARDELCERHAWKKLTGGRGKGQQDIKSHYRKAKIGDWRESFTVATLDHFKRVTGGLVADLGYDD